MATPIIGAHVSAAGGISKAVERAVLLGCQAIQIHPTAPQSWAKPSISPEELERYREHYRQSGIQAAFFHNIYLTNLASDNPATWHGAIEISKSYLELANSIGVKGVITHLGSHKGAGLDEVLPQLLERLEKILAASEGVAHFVIENTAGAGGTIGRSLEEIERIWAPLKAKYNNISICIDSCHAFASAIPVHTEEGLDAFVQEFEQRFGLEALYCIHLNDSKTEFGSNKDRHENLGDGFLGEAALVRMLQHPSLQNTPFVLEVPGIEKKGPDQENLDRAHRFATA